MKTLTEYTKNGRKWTLHRREGNIAIFTNDGRFYEVIEIQSHNGREIQGKHFPAAEYPPSNEQWGAKGFSYSHILDAFAKFEDLTQVTV